MPKSNQKESIAVLQFKMEEINKHMDKLEKTVDDGFKTLHDKLDDMIKQSDERYAQKWTERVLLSVGGIISLAIIGALLKLIILT